MKACLWSPTTSPRKAVLLAALAVATVGSFAGCAGDGSAPTGPSRLNDAWSSYVSPRSQWPPGWDPKVSTDSGSSSDTCTDITSTVAERKSEPRHKGHDHCDDSGKHHDKDKDDKCDDDNHHHGK